MAGRLRNNGFSLTEVLMAAGILAIGFAFIAGMFPVGVKLTALATEQTIAPIVVDEAIAKIKLYGKLYNELDNEPNLVDELKIAAGLGNGYVDLADALPGIPNGDPCEIDEFAYPSTDISPELQKYHWSALCGLLDDGSVHVIVFVSRKAGAAANYVYYNQDGELQTDGDWPLPVKVGLEVSQADESRLIIDENSDERSYISTGSTIVDDATGRIYRVLERILDDDEIVLILDRDWEGPVPPADVFVWVVPPAVTNSGPPVRVGGRNPCVRVDPANMIHF